MNQKTKTFQKQLQNYATGQSENKVTLRMVSRFARTMGITYNQACDRIDKIRQEQGEAKAYNYVKFLIGESNQ